MRACLMCDGDGEISAPGVGAGELAWCVRCRGTGLASPSCAGCGEPTALDTIDRVPLECVGVVVHASCDTGHAFFENRPEPEVWA